MGQQVFYHNEKYKFEELYLIILKTVDSQQWQVNSDSDFLTASEYLHTSCLSTPMHNIDHITNTGAIIRQMSALFKVLN